ncbi:MAG: hypothetical protein HY814_11110 [Candidatus Riflebacteria bacterium]|nr:hypothetical protein [Candidatus Riflebacteria bacterium]
MNGLLLIELGGQAASDIPPAAARRYRVTRRSHGNFRRRDVEGCAAAVVSAAPGPHPATRELRPLFWIYWMISHLGFRGPIALVADWPADALCEQGPEAAWFADGRATYLRRPVSARGLLAALDCPPRVEPPAELSVSARLPWLADDAAAIARYCRHEVGNTAAEAADLANDARSALPPFAADLLQRWREPRLPLVAERLDLLEAVAAAVPPLARGPLDAAARQTHAALAACEVVLRADGPLQPGDFLAPLSALRTAEASLLTVRRPEYEV